MQQTKLSIWCERIIEAGWLLALTLIPIYFNLLSARHFEPDKATTLRALVLIMAAAALVRALERLNLSPDSSSSASSSVDNGGGGRASSNPFGALWKRINSVPLALPALFYALVFVVTTITSVVPHTSFWGSYQRLQGTYTNLSYIVLFFIIVATMRRREQLQRFITVALLAGLTVAGYGLIQHMEMDPLPWRGDVITRVASTMGNAIFVAAYLIMIVPLALYRLITAISRYREAPRTGDTRSDILWALAFVLMIGGTLALLLSVIKFGAVVRTADFRYWWVFPGAIITSTTLWILPVTHSDDNKSLLIWPGIIYLLYMLFFGLTYALSQGSQQIAQQMTNGLDWWLWMLGSVAAIGLFYTLALSLPRRSAEPSRLSLGLQIAGLLVLLGAILAAIFFSQSRGPWIGLGAGLFTFFFLLLWQAARRAQVRESFVLARRLRMLMGTWIVVTLAAGGFLIAFNVSDAQFFNELRQMPYIGRMGTLLETRYGTGRVRTLIWTGDEHAGGAVALITADPLRTFIGWGPESMFVAYNPFYPPDLAQVESRGASPDRSHQAILDELVTKGFLGLISYLFLLISFFTLTWRLMRRSEAWSWQVFFIACISIIVAHFVEGLTGIPIVSTLTMLWATLGITVVGGMMAGHYRIGVVESTVPASAAAPVSDGESEPAGEPGVDDISRRKPRSRRRGKASRAAGRAGTARASSRQSTGKTSPAALALYAIIGALTIGAVWWFNLGTIYADMRFHEAEAFSEQRSGDANQRLTTLTVALDKYIDTVNSNPREDFYYLNLGRNLMTLAEFRRSQGIPLGQETPDAEVEDLLNLTDINEVATFVQNSSPLELMSYAEVVLKQARDLNELNKDHYANLARLNNFWFNWTQNPDKLREATEWYSRANEVAPQDVTLLHEHANVLLVLAAYNENQGNEEVAWNQTLEAANLLERSHYLDPDFVSSTVRLAEIYRKEGHLDEAAELYIDAVQRAPGRVNSTIQSVVNTYSDRPDVLTRLRDAYLEQAHANDDPILYSIAGLISVRLGDMEAAAAAYRRAAALEPANLENQLNYTIVLSDTQQYTQALTAAQEGLALAQQQEGKEREASQFQQLISLLQPKAAGGQ